MTEGPGAKTFMESQPKLDLTSICGGAVPELFEQEVTRVLRNLMDPNTGFKAKRTLTLTFTFETNEARTESMVTVEANSKLGGSLGAGGRIYHQQRVTGEVVAVCHDPKQTMLFDGPTRPRVVGADEQSGPMAAAQ